MRPLSKRTIAVERLMEQGLKPREIAAQLKLSSKQVHDTLHSIRGRLRRLGVMGAIKKPRKKLPKLDRAQAALAKANDEGKVWRVTYREGRGKGKPATYTTDEKSRALAELMSAKMRGCRDVELWCLVPYEFVAVIKE